MAELWLDLLFRKESQAARRWTRRKIWTKYIKLLEHHYPLFRNCTPELPKQRFEFFFFIYLYDKSKKLPDSWPKTIKIPHVVNFWVSFAVIIFNLLNFKILPIRDCQYEEFYPRTWLWSLGTGRITGLVVINAIHILHWRVNSLK